MKWRLFICSDCDTDDGVIVMQVADDANPDAGPPISNCPGCDSYLSLLGMGEVEVTGRALVHLKMRTPAEEDDDG